LLPHYEAPGYKEETNNTQPTCGPQQLRNVSSKVQLLQLHY
jgi:hypothetical protein